MTLKPVVMPKSKLSELVAVWAQDFRVVAPVSDGKSLVFKEVTTEDEMVLEDDQLTYKSPKEFLFPQVEKVMTVTADGELVEEYSADKTIILGVRPCDLRALHVLYTIFAEGKFKDPYFINHWDNTILMGLGCEAVKPGCFCQERAIDKGFSQQCDVFFQVTGDNYLVSSISEKGQQLLAKTELAHGEPLGLPNESQDVLKLEATEQELFDKIDWGRIVERCLGCGICTYICPTCHCFDFKDVEKNGAHYRYRCWDSCMYPKFTHHASGHNPRPSKKERYRQRVLHKYLYIKENTGHTACTGCGRCIRSCPAGMNLQSVVTKVMEDLHE